MRFLVNSFVILLGLFLGVTFLPHHNQTGTAKLGNQNAEKVLGLGGRPAKRHTKKVSMPVPKPATVSAPVPVPTPAPAPQPVSPVGHAYTYCVSAKGVDASYLPDLETKLASVYSDPRGWSLGGVNTFTQVTSGCSFIVWLSAAELMSSFGTICDSMWSCTVTPNVILNFDRWRYASDAWNSTGSSLDDYRSMVINHETGHWLGFYHRYCSAPGQLAPVMQQQSISMQGCLPNPWPLPAEKAAL